ncbi:caspase family protein [Flavobacterium lindanitolerans]|uniref:caspase family protein n=1 Tax=Flavobacterium lindanitolerans TaxID=428988 RepID=UPI0027BAC12A|nr:caspase family protein [Flavobacterium lindanitolerans]
MKVLAVCIGVDNAGNFTKLDNAINDAIAMEGVFKSFDYDIILLKDISIKEWIALHAQLKKELSNYDSFIFFYAGHGIEVDGENYLTTSETEQNHETKAYYDRYAIRLSEVLDLEKHNMSISKIIIVDACRNNPMGVRGAQAGDFAPIATPRGTLIAFSTTSGETAADAGYTKNSAYTGTLVHYLESSSSIQAETLFKRVRQSVYSITKGKKVTWEHTSLIDEFYFQKPIPEAIDFGYPENYIIDTNYKYSDPHISTIIAQLQDYHYEVQNAALESFLSQPPNKLNQDEKFLMGRYIIRAVSNGSFKAQNILYDNLMGVLSSFSEQTKENHLLNGMLFELYFSNTGQFRFASENAEASNVLLALRNNGLFTESFAYLNKILASFANQILYYPVDGSNHEPVSLDFILTEDNTAVREIHHNGKNITDVIISAVGTSINSEENFKHKLSGLNIPIELIRFNSPKKLDGMMIRPNDGMEQSAF